MSFKKKATSLVLTATISIGGYIIVTNKIADAKDSKHKEIVENLGENESHIEVLEDTINASFNKSGSFEVMSGELKINHTYKYKEGKKTFKIPFTNKRITILDPEMVKSGSGIALFDFDIESLSDCEVTVVDDNTLKIALPYPVLDSEKVKRKEGSFELDESKTTNNFSAKLRLIGQSIYTELKETMDARATRALEDDFDRISPEKIDEVYKTNNDKIYELETKTVASMEALMNGFVKKVLSAKGESEDVNIVIELKESRLPEDYKPSSELTEKIQKEIKEEIGKISSEEVLKNPDGNNEAENETTKAPEGEAK